MLVAAIQMEVRLGNIRANLEQAERLARAAAESGAGLIALPEFFTTGAAFLPELADRSLPPDGEAARMLSRVAEECGVFLGGSFLCRDPDLEVRNAFLLAGPDGEIRGRHDKDLPTMWENALYTGGNDDGVIEAGEFTAGAAVCWEFMRRPTAERLRGRVDLVVGGSNWWSIPEWPPAGLTRRMERANAYRALAAPASFGRLVGAPVVHGAMCGGFTCPMPEFPPAAYRGRFEGGALVADATGRILARRHAVEGEGFVVAEVEPRRVDPPVPVPERYWMHGRGLLPAIVWNTQRALGRRWYRANVRGRPAADLRAGSRGEAPWMIDS